MAIKHIDYVWLDGQFVPWEDAKLHIQTECVMRGANVFEGVRAYWNDTEKQLYIFRMKDHLDRMLNCSAKIMRMSPPYSAAELSSATVQLLVKNNIRGNAYLRPTLYFAESDVDYAYEASEIRTGAFITVNPRSSRLLTDNGVHCCITRWLRPSDNTIPARVKAGANYQNARIVRVQAKINGYDLPILLTNQGKVSEGPGACLFMVRNHIPITPLISSDILESITRTTVIELLKTELSLVTIQRDIAPSELYVADEVFFAGTGGEIIPIFSIDKYPVGTGGVGELTKKIQELYFNVVTNQNPKYSMWLLPVYSSTNTQS